MLQDLPVNNLFLQRGGFKSIFEDRFANDWILTGNLSFNIWQWIELYGDIGLIGDRGESSRFFYDSGVRLNLVTDFLSFTFPSIPTTVTKLPSPIMENVFDSSLQCHPKRLLAYLPVNGSS